MQLRSRKYIILASIIMALLVVLIIGLYPNQKSTALRYLAQHDCGEASYTVTGDTITCSSGGSIVINKLVFGSGFHYSHQGSNAVSTGLAYGCGGPEPLSDNSGDIISIFGKAFEFGTTSSTPKPTGGIAC